MTGCETIGIVPRIAAAVGKARRRGLRWLVRRMGEEIRVPTARPSHFLRNQLAALESVITAFRAWCAAAAVPRGAGEKTLYFFYDLDVAPITFDIVSQLVLAEMDRRQRGLESIHAVVVPGRRLIEEETGYQTAVGPNQRQARVDGILIPALRLLSQCRGLTICGSRAEALALRATIAREVFPDGYTPTFPEIRPHREVRDRARAGVPVFPMLSAAPAAIDTVGRFLASRTAGRQSVVISLRNYAYMPGRNSHLPHWVAFADDLDPRRYVAVFVRDTDEVVSPPPSGLDRHIVCEAASWNLGLRMALYEAAYVNLATMHGPMELCWYNEQCRYGVFVEVGSAPQTEAETLVKNGFDLGESLPFAKPWQRWYWKPDRMPAIGQAFNELSGIIDGDRPDDLVPES